MYFLQQETESRKMVYKEIKYFCNRTLFYSKHCRDKHLEEKNWFVNPLKRSK